MHRKSAFVISLFAFLFSSICAHASLRKDFEYYDIWMIREEFIPLGKKVAYERDLEAVANLRNAGEKCWPCYVVEGLDEPKYIFLSPMKNYGSLDTYFNMKQVIPLLREKNFITYAINTLLKRFTDGSYLPDESYEDWDLTPYMHYWVLSLLYDGSDDFEKHMKALVKTHQDEQSEVCFRCWRVTFGADLPKYVVVFYAKSDDEMRENRRKLELITPASRQIIRSVYEGRGLLRKDL